LQLNRSLPRRGRKLQPDGSGLFVPLKEIQPNDHIIILSGEKVVLDGVVIEGEGACDESLMTGEVLPLPKNKGSSVLGGSLLQQGRLIVKVTTKPEDSALHRIIEMVEQDIEHKSQYVRAADQIVRWFVPLVLCLAFGTAFYVWSFGITDLGRTVWQTAIIRAVSVLLISCPCAIGIAAPLAESHVLNALAKLGVIVRNRGCLPFLGRETVFVFDKTGTITEGKFTILAGLEGLTFEDQRILKGLVSQSNHPIAVALNQALLCPPLFLSQVEEISSKIIL
jgi:P-type E1-E2 ATPase